MKLYALTILFIIGSVFTFSWMWGWFAVPLGLPPVGPVHMWGLLLCGSGLRIYWMLPAEFTNVPPAQAYRSAQVKLGALVVLLPVAWGVQWLLP